MILYEFEGKKILSDNGVLTPGSQLIDSPTQSITLKAPLVLKAQVLSGKRANLRGVIIIEKNEEIVRSLKEMFEKTINGEKVEKILLEEKIEYSQEYYISLTYNTDSRTPILTLSLEGGSGVEERKVNTISINPLEPIINNTQSNLFGIPAKLINKLIKLFFAEDCLLLEINPIVKTLTGEFMALDAKVKLDDSAASRHPDWVFPPRSAPGHTPTKAEIEAKKIDELDYRGVAGSAFFDLDGDIAVMASGGGASLTALDALIKVGGKPANYTEYGGNPPREKVTKLTKVVLSKDNLHGLWVVGALANFTNIYETLSGFVEGLREVERGLGKQIDFPIVIRRAGPSDKEAFQMLRNVKDFDLHLYGEETSITESAKIILDLSQKYAQRGSTK